MLSFAVAEVTVEALTMTAPIAAAIIRAIVFDIAILLSCAFGTRRAFAFGECCQTFFREVHCCAQMNPDPRIKLQGSLAVPTFIRKWHTATQQWAIGAIRCG